jgi:MFS family permease
MDNDAVPGRKSMNDKNKKFYGWKLVAVLFAVYFLNASFPYYGGVVINSFMSADMGLDRSMLGLGFSIFSVAFGLSSPLVGMLVTRLGARRTLLGGCAVLVAGTLLMAFAVSSTWHYILYFGVIIGIGVALGSVIPIQSSLTFWFHRRKAFAMAVVMSAAGVGALVAAPSLAFIIDMSGNWRMGWVAVTITALIATIIAALGVIDKPEDIGQHPDGVDPSLTETTSSAGTLATRVYQSTHNWSVPEAITNRSWWLMVFGSFAFLAPFYVAMGHGMVHLLDLGHSKELASFSVGLVVMCSIAGRLLGGWLGDRLEPRFTWSAALGMMFASVFLLKNGSNVATIYTYAALMGIGMGASYVCMITLIGNYFGVNSYARIAGLLFPVATVLAAFSPILAGVAYDRLGSYQIAFYAAMIIALLGALLMPFATPPDKDKKLI